MAKTGRDSNPTLQCWSSPFSSSSPVLDVSVPGRDLDLVGGLGSSTVASRPRPGTDQPVGRALKKALSLKPRQQRIAGLRDDGILTEEEFQVQKRKLLEG